MDRDDTQSFGTLAEARAALSHWFGYPDFRPAQVRAVTAVLSGRDALLVLPTGGGKSICYQVPALIRDGLTVVVSPLISLMKDQVETLLRKGVGAAYLNSTLSADETAERLSGIVDGRIRLLYLAPERLGSARMLERLREVGVSLLAIDEAHCISEWGHDFRPSYRRIGAIREAIGNPQAVALTATATPQVRRDIALQLRLAAPEVVVAGFDRKNLEYHVVPVRTRSDKDVAAIRLLKRIEGAAVVYAPTRKAVESVAGVLLRGRLKVAAYHAGLDPVARQRAQDAFMGGAVNVIVATSAFGMGIDKPDVRLVLHHSMSGSLEAYYQEAGRAGRDGKPGKCFLLHSYPDRFTHEFFIDGSHPEKEMVEVVWKALHALAGRTSRIAATPGTVLSLLPRAIQERKAAAAIRVLLSSGVLVAEEAPERRVWMRLLATPARIRRELTDDRTPEREYLEAIRRVGGARLGHGVVIDLDRLPRIFAVPGRDTACLRRLMSDQFLIWQPVGAGLRLDASVRSVRELPVDWNSLALRRRSEFARLDAMQRYAVTRGCRRAFVLRYFGDPDVRADCGACDRCLGIAHDRSVALSQHSGVRKRRSAVR